MKKIIQCTLFLLATAHLAAMESKTLPEEVRKSRAAAMFHEQFSPFAQDALTFLSRPDATSDDCDQTMHALSLLHNIVHHNAEARAKHVEEHEERERAFLARQPAHITTKEEIDAETERYNTGMRSIVMREQALLTKLDAFLDLTLNPAQKRRLRPFSKRLDDLNTNILHRSAAVKKPGGKPLLLKTAALLFDEKTKFVQTHFLNTNLFDRLIPEHPTTTQRTYILSLKKRLCISLTESLQCFDISTMFHHALDSVIQLHKELETESSTLTPLLCVALTSEAAHLSTLLERFVARTAKTH